MASLIPGPANAQLSHWGLVIGLLEIFLFSSHVTGSKKSTLQHDLAKPRGDSVLKSCTSQQIQLLHLETPYLGVNTPWSIQ